MWIKNEKIDVFYKVFHKKKGEIAKKEKVIHKVGKNFFKRCGIANKVVKKL